MSMVWYTHSKKSQPLFQGAYSRRPRQACHVIANTEELPTIPIELSTKVSFVFSSPREIGELVFHGGFTKPEKKSMGFRAMDPCPKTTMGVKRAEIWNVFFFAPKIDIPTWWTEVSFATHLINLAHQKKIMAIDGCCALRLLILFEAVSSAIP